MAQLYIDKLASIGYQSPILAFCLRIYHWTLVIRNLDIRGTAGKRGCVWGAKADVPEGSECCNPGLREGLRSFDENSERR